MLEEVLALPPGERNDAQLEVVKGWLESIRCPLIESLPEARVMSVCRRMVLIRHAKGDVICKQGESADNATAVGGSSGRCTSKRE